MSPDSSSSKVPRFHVHPHGAHLDHPTPLIQAGESSVALEEEEHDYESLPVGSGWAVNMAAGAMVSYITLNCLPL